MYQFISLATTTYDELLVIIRELKAEIASLKEELVQYKTQKNSGNSHKPPSTDIATPKRNQSLREKSDKKPGGQPGHEGYTLQMKDEPDKVVKHFPCFCGNCNKNLSDVPVQFIERIQVADIPPGRALNVVTMLCGFSMSTRWNFQTIFKQKEQKVAFLGSYNQFVYTIKSP